MITLLNYRQNPITFGSSIKETFTGNKTITKVFDNEGYLFTRTEKDTELDRFIRRETYDKSGNIISEHAFEYLPNKTVETYKDQTSSYIRTISTVVKNSLTHVTEEYVSSNPDSNYLYEITKDTTGKILKWVCNGKKVL